MVSGEAYLPMNRHRELPERTTIGRPNGLLAPYPFAATATRVFPAAFSIA